MAFTVKTQYQFCKHQRTHAANIARMKSSNASIVPQKVSANDMLATSYYNGIGHTKQGHFFHTYAPKRTKSRTENR